MFDRLTERLGDVFGRLTRRGALSEADVDAALREVRVALLEADVALPVVKDFLAKVREGAVGETVLKSVTPGQMVVKIVHDELIATLDHSAGEISDRLNAIYLYSRRTLSEARLEKSPEKIEHVQALIRELREAWVQICPGAGV